MKKQRILLIEDDTYTRDAYEEILKDSGYEVDTAVDGQEGILKIHKGGYSLIFLDVMMPKVDGLDVLRSLKNDPPKTSNGPIILLTNLTHDPVIFLATDLGAKGHLVKSDITPGELVEAVKKYIQPTKNDKKPFTNQEPIKEE
ncbi:hypothetical protein A3A48_02870 [Candidatus Curtissbacteria bacterium RIFCSPLOWO2_01_FULL_37_9]|uniref:Response regulatory domain-containing protein n=1 Tax=Candidatus Curtissbacteria bacterium RIFCSPLOWO2_01_FULL_37_9 TaxID=1797724 RepID=A0A1F5GTP1_9BACT|nr:MAG: hypothetical protein A3A48_02870 [Candidatus Curtissbacteria bacterium RIFCSPLOWO2_01_FULL_37_9]